MLASFWADSDNVAAVMKLMNKNVFIFDNGLLKCQNECSQRLGRTVVLERLPLQFASRERLAVFRLACAPALDGLNPGRHFLKVDCERTDVGFRVQHRKDKFLSGGRKGCQRMFVVCFDERISLLEKAGDLHPHIEILDRMVGLLFKVAAQHAKQFLSQPQVALQPFPSIGSGFGLPEGFAGLPDEFSHRFSFCICPGIGVRVELP